MVAEDVADRPKYFISRKWYEESGRSFETVARARFCSSCREKEGMEVEERVPTVDPKTGRVVFETRSVSYGSNPLSAIRSCCSKSADYITSETPLLEAVFRIFLENGNQPIDLETIEERLSEWVRPNRLGQVISVEALERLVENDQFYGIQRFSTAED